MSRSSFAPESTDEVIGSVYFEIEVTKDADTSLGSTDISHGLGRTPTFMVMIDVDGDLYMSSYFGISGDGTIDEMTTVSVNSTTIHCSVGAVSSSPLYSQSLTRTFRVFALVDKSQ